MIDLSNLTISEDDREHIIEREKEEILKAIKELKCTFPTEVSRHTLIHKEKCISLIYVLMKENKIYRLILNPNYVPIELKHRMGYFWSINITGYENFNKMTWLIPEPQISGRYYAYQNIFTVEEAKAAMLEARKPKKEEVIVEEIVLS